MYALGQQSADLQAWRLALEMEMAAWRWLEMAGTAQTGADGRMHASKESGKTFVGVSFKSQFHCFNVSSTIKLTKTGNPGPALSLLVGPKTIYCKVPLKKGRIITIVHCNHCFLENDHSSSRSSRESLSCSRLKLDTPPPSFRSGSLDVDDDAEETRNPLVQRLAGP